MRRSAPRLLCLEQGPSAAASARSMARSSLTSWGRHCWTMGPSFIRVPKGDAGRPHPSRGWQHPGAGLMTLRHAETGIIHGISVCIGPRTSWHCYGTSGALVCSFCRSTNKPPQAAVTAHRYSSTPLCWVLFSLKQTLCMFHIATNPLQNQNF